MVPRVADKGRSFKGAMQYYLHDKRRDGEAERWTAERVAWSQTLNIGTDNLTVARRVMIGTANRAAELKRAAGEAATGRKTSKPVMAYSLAWHPDEAGKIDRAEMMRAAEASLMALGAEGHQAIVVCHNDEPHPHVHVIVNRIHPETGRALSDSKDFDRLSAWALAYREARGEHLKYCPERAKKRDERDRTRDRQPDPAKRREQNEDRKQRAATDRANEPDNSAKTGTAKTFGDAAARKLSEGAQLKTRADAMKARQKAEREFAWRTFKAKKDALWNERPSFKAIAAQHRADTRADWSAFGKAQAAERRAFRQNERVLFGPLANAMAIIQANGWREGMKGYLGQIFAWWVSPPAYRAKELERQQAADKAAFAARMNAELDRKIQRAKADHAAKIAALSKQYEATKAQLYARHGDEHRAMTAVWKDYYDRRDRAAPSRARGRGGSSDRRSTRPDPAPAPQSPTQSVWQTAAAAKKQTAPQRRDYWDGKTKPKEQPRGQGGDRGPERSGPE